MAKLAILQVADTGPLESLATMLAGVGYEPHLPSEPLRQLLRNTFARRGLVLSPRDIARSQGYELPFSMPEATPEMMGRADLYVDIKAHQIYEPLVRRWPNLKGKVAWFRINGGAIEHVVNERGDHGDEGNPPCPVITPNQWYATPGPWSDRSYPHWPPFVRAHEYAQRHGRPAGPSGYEPPVCLVHNAAGWGYGALFEPMRKMGVRIYGAGSPDGLVQHRDVPRLLSKALCMVHLKSNDAPGYAMLEAMAAACPLVCTRKLIWKCRMESLLIPGETCLVFDRETHDPFTPADLVECEREVAGHLERLRDPVENERIGRAGYERLREVCWSEKRPADVESLRAFMERHFGG